MKNLLSKHAENFICATGAKAVSLWKKDQMSQTQPDWLAEEVPIALVYNGISHVVMMASPVDLEFFALGFSLSEGIIESSREIYGIDVVLGCSGIEVRIDLSSRRFMALKARRRQIAGRLISKLRYWITEDVRCGHTVAVNQDSVAIRSKVIFIQNL